MALYDLFLKSGYKDYEKFKEYRRKGKSNDRKKILQIVEDFTKPCLFCGSEENIVYHHMNANEKKFEISGSERKSQKQVKAELEKVWCLCNDCHKKLHQRLVDPLPICYEQTKPPSVS